jgi:hypothetical protein
MILSILQSIWFDIHETFTACRERVNLITLSKPRIELQIQCRTIKPSCCQQVFILFSSAENSIECHIDEVVIKSQHNTVQSLLIIVDQLLCFVTLALLELKYKISKEATVYDKVTSHYWDLILIFWLWFETLLVRIELKNSINCFFQGRVDYFRLKSIAP